MTTEAAIRANAATLKLIGAGGAVALAIWAITRSVKAMREEFERATKAIKDQVDALTELRGQEREQRRELYAEGTDQMQRQAGGSLDAIVKVVEQATRGEGLDPMRLAQALQFLAESQRAYEAQGGKHFGYSPSGWLNEQMKAGGVKLEGGKLSEKEFATLEGLEHLILSQAETARLNRDAAELNKRAAELQAAHPPVTNNYHNQFSRNTYPDATSQRRNIRNGENLARSREGL
ncbi:MAG: hypothetical protein WBE26_10930 [Phycisphaerae bacterium]